MECSIRRVKGVFSELFHLAERMAHRPWLPNQLVEVDAFVGASAMTAQEATPETLLNAANQDGWPGKLGEEALSEWATKNDNANLRRLLAVEREAAEKKWWPKPWPEGFDGPVLAYAESIDPDRPFVGVAWWDGKKLTLMPYVWCEAATHIMPLPKGPAALAGEEEPEIASKSVLRRLELQGRVITDDCGGYWSIRCPMCGQDTMEIVRPGKVQCTKCG